MAKAFFPLLAAAILAAGLGINAAGAASGVARVISYQGRLTNAGGVNVADGFYNIKLAIYDTASGGSCIWSAKNTDANAATVDCGAPGALSVAVTGGLFSVLLGDTANGQNALPIAVYNDDTRFLGVTVGADSEMTPRRQLAVAYQALNSLTLNSFSTSAIGGANAFVPVTDASGNLLLTQTLTTGGLMANGSVNLAGATIAGANALVFDGATPNANKTTFAITDPTAARTVTFQNASGTVAYLSDLNTAGAPTADQTQFTVQGFSTQTAPLVRFTTFGGSDLISFSATGSVTVAPNQSYTGTGAVALSSGTGALTITGAGSSVWSTTAGNLTIQAGSGLVSLGTSTNLNANGALTVASGGANDLSLDAGSGLLHLGPGTNTITNTDTGVNLTLVAEGTGGIKIGNTDTLILGSQASDPVGANGAMYYDTGTDQFRCFRGGSWTDCVTGGTVTGTGSAGQVAFWTGASSQSSDSRLFWDNTAKHLGIGTSTTTAPLSVSSDDAANNSFTDMGAFVHTTTGAAANGIGNALVFLAENSVGAPSLTGRIVSILTDVTAGVQDSAFTFQTRTGGGPLTERLRIDDQGFLVPGASNNTQDIGTAANRWRTGYFGTSVVIGSTTYADGSINDPAGSFTISANGGLSMISSSGTVSLGSGSNNLTNTDADTNFVLGATRNVKIADTSLFVLPSQGSDPANPPAANGAMYYNFTSAQMRCYTGGAWGNCGTGAFISAAGITRLVTSTDQVGIGTAAPVAGTKLQVAIDDAVNNDITNVMTIDHTTSGLATAGIGAGINFRSENNTGSTTNVGHFNAFLINAAAASEASAFTFETRTGGAGVAETLRLTSSGFFPGATDNTENIGGAGNQWQNGYLGTGLIVNANTTLADGSLSTTVGNITLQPYTSGTTADVQIGVGGAGSATPDLLVTDASSAAFGAGNPGGTNGAMYYNIAAGKFRCYEGGGWKNCDTSGNTSLQEAYTNGASITTAGPTDILITLAAGDFNVTGTDAVNLTPTAASQFTSAGALTFTAGMASTWSTTAGDLSLGSGSGTLKLAAGTNTISNTSAATDLVIAATGNAKILDTSMFVVSKQAVDPVGAQATNGAMYYNTVSDLFRCFMNGSWSDCDLEAGSGATLQSVYNSGNAIITGSGAPILFTLTNGDFNVNGAGNVSFTPAGTITLTAGAASTWGTSAGNLSLQAAGAGTIANVQIGVGGAGSSTPDFLVMDATSNAFGGGDPGGGTAGAMYYNIANGKFRCYEGGGWKNCDTTGGTTTLQTAYDAGQSITTSSSHPLLLTLASGNFNVTGTGAVNLTPTAASQFTSAGSLTFTAGAGSTWSTTAGALTLTSAGAATWGTSSGNLSLVANNSSTGDVQVGTGAGTATPDLLVMDIKNDNSSDPAGGIDGAMYYNGASDRFRCFRGGNWEDCLGTWIEVGSINEMKIPGEQLQIGATAPPAGSKVDISLNDASNNSASNVLVLDHTTSGTAAAGIGSNILFRDQNDAGNPVNAALISAVLTNAANTTEDSSLRFSTRAGGAVVEQLRLTNVGTLQPGATNNANDLGATGNRWRTGYFGTSAIVGGTTLTDGGLASGGVLSISSGGGSALSLSSSSGTLSLATGTNTISNASVATDLNISPTRNVKIADTSLLVFSNRAADPGTAANGASYYNTTTNTFRCYVNGLWVDCAGGAVVTGSGTAGQVSFWNGPSSQTGDNELYWDNATKQLGIGTNDFHVGTKVEIEQLDANNNGISDVVAIEHNTSGTPANGIGVGLLLRSDNSTGSEVSAARISGVLTSVTPGAEAGAILFEPESAGNIIERARIDTAGNLTFAQATTISSGSTGTMTLESFDQSAGSTNSAAVTIESGNAAGATSNSGNITIDAGTATGAAGTINIGTANASAISVGRAGITNTNNGAVTVAQLLTGQLGLTVTGAAVNLNASSNFPVNILTGTSTGAITIGNAAAGAINITNGAGLTITSGAASTWSSTAGNLTLQAGSGTVSLGTSTLLTAAGSLGITSTGASTFQTSSGALTITSAAGATWSTTVGALTLTSAAATTWSTVAGALTVDSAAALNLGTTNATSVSVGKSGATTTVNGALSVSQLATASNGLTVSSGNITVSSGNIVGGSPLSFDGGTADAIKTVFAITDPTGSSKTITFPNATITVNAAADISGTTLASNVVTSSLTNVGALAAGSIVTGFGAISTANNISTTSTGTITSAGLLTGSAGLTVSGGAVSLNNNSNNNTSINTGTSTGTVTIGNGAAGAVSITNGAGLTITAGTASTWSTAAGNLTLQAGSGTVSLGTSTTLTAGGALTIDSNTTNALNIGNGGNAKTITIGNNTTTTALNITSGTGAQTHASSNATGTTTASSFVFTDSALSSGTLAYLTSTSTSGKLMDLNFSNTTGTIMNGAYGAGAMQGAGALTAMALNLNTNLTAPAAGQNVTGVDIKLPTASTTSNATIYNGFSISTAGAITNATAGSFNWHGASLTMPNITQSAGGTVHADGLIVTTGSITTGGTEDGLDVTATGVGAGSLNGVMINNITGGAGTETAIQVGTGWDQGLTIGVTPSATTGRTIDVAGNWGGNAVVDVHLATTSATVTESTKALTYFLTLCNVATTCSTGNGTQGAAPTTTFNITGLPDTDGTFAFIETQVQRIGVGGGANENATIILHINGTQVSTVTTGAANTDSAVIIENYTVVRSNSIWRVTGATGTSDSADLAEWIPFTGDEPIAGSVVRASSTDPVTVTNSSGAYDPSIIGVVSTQPHATYGTDDSHSVRLALAGRVPVRVSTENGPIKIGDHLTSSSVPGVAMRATLAGQTIGQALSSYSGDGEGMVTALVHTGNYQGSFTSLAQNGLDTDVLAALVAANDAAPDRISLSDILTDRLAAGLEIIAPKILAKGLTVDSIGSANNLLTLTGDVSFIGTPFFNSDTAGFAKIYAGNDHVDVAFDKEYSALPIVNATISFENISDEAARLAAEQGVLSNDVRFIVTRVSDKGFTILLNGKANSDVPFSWTAFAVKDAKTFTSNDNASAPVVEEPPAKNQILTPPPVADIPVATAPPADVPPTSDNTNTPPAITPVTTTTPVTTVPTDTTTPDTTPPPADAAPPADATTTTTTTDTTPAPTDNAPAQNPAQ